MTNFNFDNFTEEEFYNQIKEDSSIFIGREVIVTSNNQAGILIEFIPYKTFFKVYLLDQNGSKHYLCLVGFPFTTSPFTSIKFI